MRAQSWSIFRFFDSLLLLCVSDVHIQMANVYVTHISKTTATKSAPASTTRSILQSIRALHASIAEILHANGARAGFDALLHGGFTTGIDKDSDRSGFVVPQHQEHVDQGAVAHPAQERSQ
ncbi:hypothetical protein BJ912DRAFT_970182 [Pholiota molesta]|nr:hypothetical protein BJ912DRAFT_970182 [Pholiota molesta]